MFLLFRISIIILTPLALVRKLVPVKLYWKWNFHVEAIKMVHICVTLHCQAMKSEIKKSRQQNIVFVHCWPPAICICMTQKNSYSDQYLETVLIICVFAQSSNKEQIMVIQQECHILFLYSKSRQCRLLKYYVLISFWLAFGPWPADGISISCQCRIKFFGVVRWLLIVITFSCIEDVYGASHWFGKLSY